MRLAKKILFGSGILFIAIQFIRPTHNQSRHGLSTDISSLILVPDSVRSLLKNACFDCHSNYTRYPWYFKVQPVSWFLTNHINQAKEKLNFSQFGDYSVRRQISKLNGIANSIKDNTMPLLSYRLMHIDARLDKNEKNRLLKWTQMSLDSLAQRK